MRLCKKIENVKNTLKNFHISSTSEKIKYFVYERKDAPTDKEKIILKMSYLVDMTHISFQKNGEIIYIKFQSK